MYDVDNEDDVDNVDDIDDVGNVGNMDDVDNVDNMDSVDDTDNVDDIDNQGGIMTGNLGTRFPQNLHTQPKYFIEVPLFDKMCIDMNIFEHQRIK